jgi:peptide/nickel transport system permease protein
MVLTNQRALRKPAVTAMFPTEEQWLRGVRRRKLRRYIPVGTGVLLIFVMVVAAITAPLIAPFSPSAQSPAYVLKGPGADGGSYVLGTDDYGRDLFSRIVWGTRVSLKVGLGAVIAGFLIGVPLGIMAGFLGGSVEAIILRFMDMLLAFPTLLLALVIVTALGGSLVNEIVAIGIALMPNFVRLARSLALTIRETDYIVAARALGGSQIRVMLRHVFPNAVSTLLVISTLYIASAIRAEASLSFLGLGIPPPAPSWGNILSEGRQYIRCCPWLTTFSGLSIMLAVLAFNVVGDALRDLLDPRLRGE